MAQVVEGNALQLRLVCLTGLGYLGYPWVVAKVLVSLDDTLLRRVDRIAKARGLSRSAYLAQLAEHDAKRTQGPGASAVARRALERLDELFAESPAGDSTVALRSERDSR